MNSMPINTNNTRTSAPTTTPAIQAQNEPIADPSKESFFDPVSHAMEHIQAFDRLNSTSSPLLGAFTVRADAQDACRVLVESERLNHLEGAVTHLNQAVENLRRPEIFAAVVARKGSAAASAYGAALGVAAAHHSVLAIDFILSISIIAQNHHHGPMLHRQLGRGRIKEDGPELSNWRAQKDKQAFYEEISTASEAFAPEDNLAVAPAWKKWEQERTAKAISQS